MKRPSKVISDVRADLADAAAPQIWSLAAAADGTWVAGTGGDGRVLVSRAGRVTTLFDAPEPQIYAVALAPDGRVFAGSSPDGKVYVIDASGQSRVFADPGEKYIWGLTLDSAGRLWIAAGTPAVLYLNPRTRKASRGRQFADDGAGRTVRT